MSIRGSIVLECDQKGCYAELVIDDLEFDVNPQRGGLEIDGYAPDWREDEHGLFWCPDCAGANINPRQRGDDDGREYADPRDYLAGRE